MKRAISLILGIVIILSLMLAISVSAAETASGSCGKDVTWTLEDGVLTISGTGAMEQYQYEVWNVFPLERSTAPWFAYYERINSVIIGEGVTTIGNYAFAFCTGLMNAQACVKSPCPPV